MGAHLIDGEFQSDKYPTVPRGKVPLSVRDPAAQDLLWEYAHRRRVIDSEFSDDLETALRAAGYCPPALNCVEHAKAVEARLRVAIRALTNIEKQATFIPETFEEGGILQIAREALAQLKNRENQNA